MSRVITRDCNVLSRLISLSMPITTPSEITPNDYRVVVRR